MSTPSLASATVSRKFGAQMIVLAPESVMIRRRSLGWSRKIAGVITAPARQIAW